MLIIRASKDPEFREAVEKFQLRAEDLSPVEGEEYVYQLLAPSVAQMPVEMTAIVKLLAAKVRDKTARALTRLTRGKVW
jgi:hypothetical protein